MRIVRHVFSSTFVVAILRAADYLLISVVSLHFIQHCPPCFFTPWSVKEPTNVILKARIASEFSIQCLKPVCFQGYVEHSQEPALPPQLERSGAACQFGPAGSAKFGCCATAVISQQPLQTASVDPGYCCHCVRHISAYTYQPITRTYVWMLWTQALTNPA